MDMIKIGENIQKLRKRKKMTQSQLGERLRVSYQAVSKWERGEALPDTMILLDLASILETSVDNILSAGERIMNFNKKICTEDIKKGIESLAGVGDKIGKDNSLYESIVEGVNSTMNLNLEECLHDPYMREGLIVEVMVQNIMNGAYVDISDAKMHLQHEHWRNVVCNYAEKYGIK